MGGAAASAALNDRPRQSHEAHAHQGRHGQHERQPAPGERQQAHRPWQPQQQ